MIDTHAHLEGLPDPRAALARAWGAGVRAVVAVAMDRQAGQEALALAASEPRVWPAVGLHPWRVTAEELEAELAFVAAELPRAVALGEVGLDYKLKVPKDLQKAALAAQLDLAWAHGKPALVHCRFSETRVLEALARAGVRAVFHWFAAPPLLERVVAEGHYISATPAVATSPPHRQAVAACPLDRLLLETDTPVEHAGRPTGPDRVTEACRLVAELRGFSPAAIARRTTANALTFLGRELSDHPSG
ncbi:MAG: TatD family hydrolase [Deltaproteobacteria bacterium]|nr:TatD family hydrolase [Deltaproteobacteria bacterium]